MIKRLTVIGVGLIGGSLARALRGCGAVAEIVGSGRNVPDLTKAVELGVIDRFELDPATAVRGADMVVIAVTLGATPGILQAIAPQLDANAIVTDVGSAKRGVVDAARTALQAQFPRFVPGHPIAGAERSGVTASVAGLFVRHRVILTPLAETAPDAVARVQSMWQRAGASVTQMDVDHHDQVLAATSHLPHMLAYALVDCLAGMSDSGEIFDYAAGGFRDFTRIASSSPDMWRDIALENRQALIAMCDRFTNTFGQLRAALATGDAEALHAMFRRAKSARDEFKTRTTAR